MLLLFVPDISSFCALEGCALWLVPFLGNVIYIFPEKSRGVKCKIPLTRLHNEYNMNSGQ